MNAVGTRAEGECFRTVFDLSQTLTSVFIVHETHTDWHFFLFLLENTVKI